MKVIGVTCTRNEEGRYLKEFLEWNTQFLDLLYVFDDLSSDGTFEVLSSFDGVYADRSRTAPRFEDNESKFRSAAWISMEMALSPEPGDLIVALDADEFLMSAPQDWDDWVDVNPNPAFRVKIHECFGAINGVPQIRTDGFWDYIANTRIARYQKDCDYADVMLGGGSLPEEMMKDSVDVNDLSIMHLGYATEADRKAKYRTYSNKSGEHNKRHIESIVGVPKLHSWKGDPLPVKMEERT